MAEDRTAGPTEQEPSNQKSIDFLDAFIPSLKGRLFLAGSVPGLKRLRVVGYYSDERMLALPDNERHHVTSATYPEGLAERDDNKATAVWNIVFDDIGKIILAQEGTIPISRGIEIDEDVFILLPDPSWKMETSSGCYQYGYHFEPSLTPGQARWLLSHLKRNPVLAKGLHSLGQYFRLPSGTNTKPGRAGFRTRLTHIGPSYTLQGFCEGFGIDPDDDAVDEREPFLMPVHGEQLTPNAVGLLLALIPNDDLDYDAWIRVGHAIWGATGGSEEGRELFLDWSAKSAKFNLTQDTSKTWDSFSSVKASASTLRVIIEERHGADSAQRREAERIFATEMFSEIDEAGIPDGVADPVAAKVEKQLGELLQAIHKTQKVPRHHRSGDSAHWGIDGKVQTLRQAAISIVAPPVILTPYERGILSVFGGMPGLGKSLLILQQALAITYGRKDLIRHGNKKLNFAGDVIYISNEDGLGVMKRRFRAWERRHGLVGQEPPFEVIPLRSTLLSWTGKAWQTECLDILEMILEYVQRGRDIAMIVVDTLATSVTGIDENQAKDINPVMLFLDKLAKAFWASVVFVHHVNKGSIGDEDRSLVALKGSISIGGAVRGATTLTPANRIEISEYGWEGREIVVEYVAKANDDRARYVACYYELETEDIEVADAVDPTQEVMQPTPVLTPLHPVRATEDMERLTGWFEALQGVVEAGHVLRVYSANATNVGANSVHHVLCTPVRKAYEIVTKLVSVGWIELVDVRDEGTHRRITTVSITRAF